MKFVTAKNKKGKKFIGIVQEDKVIHLRKLDKLKNGESAMPKTMIGCIAMGDEFLQKVNQLLESTKSKKIEKTTYSIEDVEILAPISSPLKNIFCVGKNYKDHVIEMGSAQDIPKDLILFTKAPTTVISNGDLIPNHKDVTDQLDYEGELAIVIGKKGKAIKKDEALDYVFGYTVINDVSARDIQKRHKQYFLGKSLDGTCPMGPWIVEKSEIANPNNLHIETKVNGEVRQNANTDQFIFPVEEIIETISKGMTLEPGDIIATGTPAGVGNGFNPPRFLKSGDEVAITIENIGTLTNKVQ